MLVLRRKVGEAIVLNGVITVYVLAVEGERVKLGINAPPDVVIVRQELLDAVAQENRAARRQGQSGEGEGGGEGGGKSSHEPPPEGSGRRDLRAMLDRALSNPDGTLSPHGTFSPRNGHQSEQLDTPRPPVHQRAPVQRREPSGKSESEAQGTEDQKPG